MMRRLSVLGKHIKRRPSSRRFCSARHTGDTANGLEVIQIPALEDNYAFLVHCADTKVTACVDTPEGGPIVAELKRRGWTLTHIINTHWHPDHTGANLELKETYGCTVIGPRDEADQIPGIDLAVGHGDEIDIGSHRARVVDVGGHTSGHIAYYLPDQGIAFVGDTIFALGCGRIFEGTAEQMWDSIQRLATLPDDTVVYCAHEYTQSNAKFAVTIEPSNLDLQARKKEIDALRAQGFPTVPTSIGLEKRTNPFLRVGLPEFRQALGVDAGLTNAEVFAEIRQRKDRF